MCGRMNPMLTHHTLSDIKVHVCKCTCSICVYELQFPSCTVCVSFCPVICVCVLLTVLQPGFGASPGSSDANAPSIIQGKRNLQNQASTGSTTTTTSGNRMRNQLANAILGGEGTARDLLARRKRAREASQQCKMSREITYTQTIFLYLRHLFREVHVHVGI